MPLRVISTSPASFSLACGATPSLAELQPVGKSQMQTGSRSAEDVHDCTRRGRQHGALPPRRLLAEMDGGRSQHTPPGPHRRSSALHRPDGTRNSLQSSIDWLDTHRRPSIFLGGRDGRVRVPCNCPSRFFFDALGRVTHVAWSSIRGCNFPAQYRGRC